ncbi:MAG: hypothetical protein H0X69_08625 [Gemmatimonadales bacterium]|nr:hypothetical protein [Gemmatimonadales bacterium]
MRALLRCEPATEPVKEYELRDMMGRPIGQVLRPSGVPRTGRGAETVLLVRSSAAAGSGRVSSAA